MNRNLTIISGSSHPNFADLVAEQLGFTPHHVLRGKFANGEIRFELLESVRGSDVYVIQTSCSPINDMLMELLIMVQTCRYASANKITAVIPFFPYSRQDKMFSWQQPITAKLVANMLSVAGANHIVTMDLHAAQLQGFFDIPCDNLASIVTLIPWIHRYIPDWQNGVVVAPDNGAVKIATKLRDSLNLPMALIHKQRRHKNARYELVLVGDVHGKVTIVVDDMIDTSNTLCFAAERLKEAGSSKIYAIVTHGIFSGDSIQKLNDSDYELVICTNTIPQAAEVAKNPKFRIVDVSYLFSKIIYNMHFNKSVQQIFNTQSSLGSLEPYIQNKTDSTSVYQSQIFMDDSDRPQDSRSHLVDTEKRENSLPSENIETHERKHEQRVKLSTSENIDRPEKSSQTGGSIKKN